MSRQWTERLSDYLDDLETDVNEVSALLETIRIDTVAAPPQPISESVERLAAALRRMQQRIAQREQLLRADDAPEVGTTLTEKSRHAAGPAEAAVLTARCRAIAGRTETVHQQTLAIFVCQYHLADLCEELLQCLSGGKSPATYGPRPRRSGGGALLNQSG
jgi:hypothetical protein